MTNHKSSNYRALLDKYTRYVRSTVKPKLTQLPPPKKTSTLIFFICAAIVFVGILLSFYIWFSPSSPAPSQQTTPSAPVIPTNPDGVYQNVDFGFELKYPVAFAAVQPEMPYYRLSSVLLSLQKDQSHLTVAYDPEATGCGEIKGGWESLVINDVSFYYRSNSSAGAGDQYYSDFYRTTIKDKCFEIAAIVHIDDGSGDASGVSAAKNELKDIISTFKLLTSSSSTSDWKTYENKKHGFSFQYSSASTFTENEVFIGVGEDQLFSPKPFTTKLLSGQQEACKDFYKPDPTVRLTPNGVKYYYVCDGYWILSPQNDAYLDLDYKDTAVQILSTFKFLSTTDSISDWKTYENKKVGLSLKYPAVYQVKAPMDDEPYIVMLLGSDYKVVTNDFGSKNTGSYYYLSESLKCLPQDIVGNKKVISSKDNITIYQITGYEAPDYKSSILVKPGNSKKCFELSCSSSTNCNEPMLDEFDQILSTFKFL